MDLATVVGFIGGAGLVIGAMSLAGPLGTFWDFTSLLIVLGGSVFSTLMKMPMKSFMSALKAVSKIFKSDNLDPSALIDDIVRLADTARKNSILALEKEKAADYDYLNKAIRFMVDGLEPEVIDKIMSSEMAATVKDIKMQDTLTQWLVSCIRYDWYRNRSYRHDDKTRRCCIGWSCHGRCPCNDSIWCNVCKPYLLPYWSEAEIRY